MTTEIQDEQAIQHAHGIMRHKLQENPCYLCEQVDCEGCEHFETKNNQ